MNHKYIGKKPIIIKISKWKNKKIKKNKYFDR